MPLCDLCAEHVVRRSNPSKMLSLINLTTKQIRNLKDDDITYLIQISEEGSQVCKACLSICNSIISLNHPSECKPPIRKNQSSIRWRIMEDGSLLKALKAEQTRRTQQRNFMKNTFANMIQ